MMNKQNILLSFLLMLATGFAFAQQQKSDPDKISTYYFYKKQTLVFVTSNGRVSASVKEGSHIVLIAEEKRKDDPNIADDEMTERFAFEIPRLKSKFSYKLSAIPAVYMKGCFCTDRGYHLVKTGYIKGRRMANGQWRIRLHLQVNTGENGTTKVYDLDMPFSEGTGSPRI